MMVVFPKVLVMIHSKMWLESDTSLERSVRRLAERLYIRYEEKKIVRNDYFYRDGESWDKFRSEEEVKEFEFRHVSLRTWPVFKWWYWISLGHISAEFKVMFEATAFWESSLWKRIFKAYDVSLISEETWEMRYRTLNMDGKWNNKMRITLQRSLKWVNKSGGKTWKSGVMETNKRK